MTSEDALSILLVDDDAAILQSAARILARAGRVTTAADAAAARTLIAGARFDVVVSDFAMPGENGLSLLAFVRTAQPEALLVLFSGADIARGEAAVQSGAIDHAFAKANGFAPLLGVISKTTKRRP